MSATKDDGLSAMQHRINAEIQDNLDEDLELELEDSDLADLLAEGHELPEQHAFPRRLYFTELLRLQRELIKLQDWVVNQEAQARRPVRGPRRGRQGRRDQAHHPAPQPARLSAPSRLPAPGERERSQWYFQRYVPHLPAGGEIVLFDRSWYNRAGVERVMGFCTDEEYEDFFQSVPEFERLLVRSGIVLVKYWFSISDDEQHLRFLMRINDPLKQWKLSPMDLEFRRRWEAYTKAKEIMLERTHIPEAPWWVVEAVDKKRARLNCIAHLLTRIPYEEVPHEKPVLPPRAHNPDYHREPVPRDMYVPDHYAAVVGPLER